MIKRYNQFIKGKLNEEFTMTPEIETPETIRTIEEKPEEFKKDVEYTEFAEEEEEVAADKYEMALKTLADSAGVEFESGQKSVVIDGKEVTFPAETEKYHIQGVKKSFSTVEDVLANIGGQTNTPTERKSEVRDEMSSIKDEEVLDEKEQLESKSYKFKRFKK